MRRICSLSRCDSIHTTYIEAAAPAQCLFAVKFPNLIYDMSQVYIPSTSSSIQAINLSGPNRPTVEFKSLFENYHDLLVLLAIFCQMVDRYADDWFWTGTKGVQVFFSKFFTHMKLL